MNKKIFAMIFLLTIILVTTYSIKPKMLGGINPGEKPFVYQPIYPKGTIYLGDIIFFGGTMYNNFSETIVARGLAADIYKYNGTSKGYDVFHTYDFTTPSDDPRYQLLPGQFYSFKFQTEIIKDDLPLGNYSLMLRLQFSDVDDDRTNNAYMFNVDDRSKQIIVSNRREPAPNYIWAVLILLILGLMAIAIVAIVSYIRGRKKK